MQLGIKMNRRNCLGKIRIRHIPTYGPSLLIQRSLGELTQARLPRCYQIAPITPSNISKLRALLVHLEALGFRVLFTSSLGSHNSDRQNQIVYETENPALDPGISRLAGHSASMVTVLTPATYAESAHSACGNKSVNATGIDARQEGK